MGAELLPVADGVFCWQHDVRDRLAANIGVVVDDESLTLIDSGGLRESFVPLAARLAAFGRPVTRIMLTHEHPDHVGGAGAGAFGDAQVYSSRTTADALVNAPMIQVLQRLHPAVADQVEELRHPARPLVLEAGDVHGRVRVDLLAGHTDGDLVIHVDDAETAFAGDLCFFGTIPVGFSAEFGTWQQSLHTIAASRPVAIVPGHGAVGTVDDVVELAGYLDALLEASRRDPAADEPDGLPSAVKGWWDPWHDRIPHATHRMNLERARQPGDIPPTLLELIQER